MDEQEKVEKANQERTEMELKFLKSQINPHVLLNNLNTIYAYSIDKPTQTPDLILKLSENLKHVLYETNTNTVLLEKELTFIENYIAFQKIRTQGIKKVNYNSNVDNSIYSIAPLLLITIIENAFKHSSVHSEINIDIDVMNAKLTLTCTNMFDADRNSNSNTIGLKNLQKRLALIYPNKHDLTFEEKNSLFSVILNITLN